MQTYTEVFDVRPNDLDELEHVNNIRFVQWIQEISKKHWFKATDAETRESLIWVVKNHHISYHKQAKLGDAIQIITYIESTTGPISKRVVEFKNNKTGVLLVKGITEWCLLDATTFKPKRVPVAVQHLFNNT
ncbi:thioesterase family protein [Flagellimonas sp. S3867]|uniref:acyl-CoA thioesterase n=1 Tax=Flagellimonas sp. S3867 TaxID=2768063 RepID=UPI00168313DC|nr:acyl-CoA thioesterase [Flagellimonas sp. S3867]